MARTPEMITMSMREADRLKTIQAVTDRMLGVAPGRAADGHQHASGRPVVAAISD
jgi:hypothetical protein